MKIGQRWQPAHEVKRWKKASHK